jgi:hypothetical protein
MAGIPGGNFPLNLTVITSEGAYQYDKFPKEVGFRIEKVLGLITNLKDGCWWAEY